MNNENENLSPERDDPFSFLFTHEKSQTDIKEEISPRGSFDKLNTFKNSEEITKVDSTNVYKDGYKYDFGYTILLTNPNEDGLMDTYLNETVNELDKPREDPSDWFNFGFDEEKWIKFLNKSILMHYERLLMQQQMSSESSTNAPNVNHPHMPYGNPNMPIRPVAPGGFIPNYPQQYPLTMYRGYYPPGMMYPPMNPNIHPGSNISHMNPEKDDTKNK